LSFPKIIVSVAISNLLFLKDFLAFPKDFIPGDEKFIGLAYNLNPILSKRDLSFETCLSEP
jgi:hypothetical protein